MSAETAELILPVPAIESGAREGARRRARPWRLTGERAEAARVAWRALAYSRLLVWVAGVGTVLAFGWGPVRRAFNPPGVTRGFGRLGDLLAAPAARWDAAWYLVIAHHGYNPALGGYTAPRDAFFPLYPLSLRVLSLAGLPAIAAGVAISLIALAAALYGLHRLMTLELGAHGGATRAGVHAALGDGGARVEVQAALRAGGTVRPAAQAARLAVLACAFAPMAFFLSAVYSEALYLALSVGLFWSARNGRWAWAGVLGGLAAATRSAGLVLLVPALFLYLYGPRADRAPDFARAGGGRWALLPGAGGRFSTLLDGGRLSALLPRYRLRADVLWLCLLPAGLIVYGAYLGLAGGDPLAPLHSQAEWGRHFAGPFAGAWQGLEAAFDGARQLLSFQRGHLYYPTGGESAFVSASHNLVQFAFLASALVALVGVFRRLPAAYGIYVVAALALPLSYPARYQPLMSLPRFLLVLFPLFMWLGMWLSEHPRLQRGTLLASAALLALFGAQFTTWHWVA